LLGYWPGNGFFLIELIFGRPAPLRIYKLPPYELNIKSLLEMPPGMLYPVVAPTKP